MEELAAREPEVLPPAAPGAPSTRRPRSPWQGTDWWLLAGITLLGAVLRFWRLGYPHRFVFDETYYAKDACLYLGHALSFCHAPAPATVAGALGIGSEQSFVHPELGKWLIAAGEWLFGYNTWGWRVPSALFGTGLVVLGFLLGRRLFGRSGGAAAGFLVAIDFVLIEQSRLAMLDIFLAFFVVLGFLFVVLDHDRVLAPLPRPGSRLDLRWRIAAGLAFGAACAVKWSGAYALAGATVLMLFWNVSAALRRSKAQVALEPRVGLRPGAEAVVTVAALAVPAAALYLISYGKWFVQHHFSFSAFVHLQHAMLSYQLHLNTPNPYQARAWTWPFEIRPIAYWHIAGNLNAHQILLFPNPGVWWAAIPAGLWMLYRAARRRHWPERIVMTGWLVQYLPWLAVSRPLFFFYMTPVTPFMDLALAGGLLALAASSPFRRRLVVVYLIGMAALLAYYYPGLVGALHPRL
ncbi:MAG: phospholipid carrier-dependent glycosyltransferase [Actinomycetota bacterium]